MRAGPKTSGTFTTSVTVVLAPQIDQREIHRRITSLSPGTKLVLVAGSQPRAHIRDHGLLESLHPTVIAQVVDAHEGRACIEGVGHARLLAEPRDHATHPVDLRPAGSAPSLVYGVAS